MSWHFLQEGVVASWQDGCLAGAPSALLKLMPGQEESCSTGSWTGLSSSSRYGMTLEPSTQSLGVSVSKSLQADSHVKTSAFAAQAQGSMDRGLDYGLKWRDVFASFDQSSCSWKTPQCSLLGGLEEFSATWPAWGTMQAGECFERPPLEQHIKEPGFTWLLTPTAQSWKAWTFRNPLALIRKNHADGNLQEQLMRLFQRMTTPRCQEILMMWPEGWTASEPLGMDGFQQWLREQQSFLQGRE